ncbi:hypothetical protein CRE_25412 [Caenorhabditis remanei]|uniref:TM2 domain-containing protein n=1 Tax=Caenorhabditis remanei TaxID=31234 RepID=E3LT12_CAERE|nr:hypothetical protein CRE_25412 [Caenorhabditis remanei]
MRWFSWLLLLFIGKVTYGKGDFEIEFEYPKKENFEKCIDSSQDEDLSDFHYTSINPLGPIVECHLLGMEFIACEDPVPLNGPGQTGQQSTNESFHKEGKCERMGGYRAEDIEFTEVKCRVLPCIECRGPRGFTKSVPCIIYTGHYFLTTLLYSIFLGVVAVDRFCLGYSAMAVGKLMTLGGFGIWWIVDIFLLVLGVLGPADDSNWEPYY